MNFQQFKLDFKKVEEPEIKFTGSWKKEESSRKTYAAAAAKLLELCLTLYDPIRQQPTRLPRPWDSPGKNAGVGCHFLLHCMKMESESEVT